MKKLCLILSVFLASTTTSVLSAEAGVGRENDTPDALPPTDPAPSETSQSLLQQLLESFGLADDIEQ